MNLPFLKKKETKEYFLALSFKQNKIGIILFQEENKRLSVFYSKEVEHEKNFESLSAEEYVSAADSVITLAEKNLSEQPQTYKTIFCVPYNWVENGKIKRDFLIKFKKICDELSLTPIGFIVSIEALVHFLQKKEGVPPTAIFLEVLGFDVFVHLVRAGEIVEVKKGLADPSISFAVARLLKQVERFEVLPSRIILLNSHNAQELQQDLLSFPWTSKLPFLHLPQVLIIEREFENEALINGVASELGLDMLQKEVEEKELSFEQDEEVRPQDFGFFTDKDVLSQEQEAHEKEEFEIQQLADESERKYESKQYDDISSNISDFEDERELEKEDDVISKDTDIKFDDIKFIKNTHQTSESYLEKIFKAIPKLASIIFSFFEKSIDFILSLFPSFSIPNFLFRKGIVSVVTPIIMFILVVLYIYYFFILKAEVILFADKKQFNKETQVIFSTSNPSLSHPVLPINIETQEAEGEVGKETTGKKETGDKAKGEVTIYNKTEQKKTFNKGGKVSGPNNLEFKLVDDLTIASTSAFATSIQNGKVKVEATKFGTESNLPSSTNFVVEDFPTSSFFAKNEVAFSGGTKKTIKVVSQKDLDDLENEIINSSKKKVFDAFSQKMDDNSVTIPDALSFEFIEKNFDKKRDEEANKVSLSAKIAFELGIYKKDDVIALAKSLAKDSIPKHYLYVENESKIEVKDIKVDKDRAVLATLIVNSVYMPKIDSEKITKNVSGKSVFSAEKNLGQVLGISDSKIRLKNKLPVLPEVLPLSNKNISIEVKTNE